MGPTHREVGEVARGVENGGFEGAGREGEMETADPGGLDLERVGRDEGGGVGGRAGWGGGARGTVGGGRGFER